MNDPRSESLAERSARVERRNRRLGALAILAMAVLAAAVCMGQPPPQPTFPAELVVSRDAEIFGRLVAASLFLVVIVGALWVLIKGWRHLALREADVPRCVLLKLSWRTILVCVGAVLVASGFEAVMMALGRI